MKAKDLRTAFINFFKKKGHQVIPSAPLVPEEDQSTLFISAGMHPLVPYLLGEPHPLGKRLVSCQKCLRTEDIETIGSSFRHTFFEMLGNWSLGDYFKKEAIAFSWEFLTKILRLDPKRIFVTIFKGDQLVDYDQETEQAWLAVGLPKERIFPLGREDNWWEAGETGPGGPDTEIYYDTGRKPCRPNCKPSCQCGKYFEIWNNVFMEYNRLPDGSYQKLKQKNVDTGMGVERTTAILEGKDDDYTTELFWPIIEKISHLSEKKYQESEMITSRMRIIADHLRAASFIIADGITPSNVRQGYVLRRLVRRAIKEGKKLGINRQFTSEVSIIVVELFKDVYPELAANKTQIINQLEEEEFRFAKTLKQGLHILEKEIAKLGKSKIFSGKLAFDLYQTYGFPIEMIEEEIANTNPNLKVDLDGFNQCLKEHQEKSRKSAKDFFRGGLKDQSLATIKLHTATHLLQQSLREILGGHISQVGSAITPEKLRFDFVHPKKLTSLEITAIERLVNQKIKDNLLVEMKILPFKKAVVQQALTVPGKNYPSFVKVYSIKDPKTGKIFSREVCGGPHVKKTGVLGKFKIIKEEACGTGKRRIYAVLEK